MYALGEEQGIDSEAVADRYGLDAADVYHALAYSHDHPREMSHVEAERAVVREQFHDSVDRPDGVDADTVRSTFGIDITSDSSRSRSALTGCGGSRTAGTLAYDHRTRVQWKRDTLLDTDRHYASATGRGEWAYGTHGPDTG